MSGASIRTNPALEAPAARDGVWVLDDWRDGADSPAGGRALGVAERLGVPFRRVPLVWTRFAPVSAVAGRLGGRGSLLGIARAGSQPALWDGAPPALVIAAGARAIGAALWLKVRHGARVVHCGPPSFGRGRFDLRIAGTHELGTRAEGHFPILGMTHRASPVALAQEAACWAERLGHLPRPLVLVLTGGEGLKPAPVLTLANRVAATVRAAGGSVVAIMGQGTERESADALAAGLMTAMHLIWRPDDPGPNPYLALLGLADAVIVTGVAYTMLAEACSGRAPVYVALEELAGGRQERLQRALRAAGQIRSFRGNIGAWTRQPLDETGRVASEIVRRFMPETSHAG